MGNQDKPEPKIFATKAQRHLWREEKSFPQKAQNIQIRT